MNGKIFVLTFAGLLACPGLTWAAEDNTPKKFDGFNLEGYGDGGEKVWDVKGDTADIIGDTITISNVDGNHYGDQTINLKARKGTLDKASGNILLEKDVVITSETGSEMKTDTLNWNKDKDLVTTEDPVTIDDPHMTASGIGLKAQPGLGTAEMKQDVTVRVKDTGDASMGGVVTVTSDGPMEIDQQKSMATFNVNVVAVQNDRTLKADKMEILFDQESRKLKKLICTGNVVILQGENSTLSERAVYNAEDQKMTLSGRPKMIMMTEGEAGFGALKP